MESKFNTTKEAFAETLDLPKDVVLNLPKITIIANHEICIENHKGILIFTEKEIKINSKVGIINITGENFEILYLGGSTITISGKFKSVLYGEYEHE